LTQQLGEGVAQTVDFDRKKHEIITSHVIPGVFGFCSVEAERYRVENNRLILIHKVEISQINEGPLDGAGLIAPEDRPACTVTVSDLIGGTMRVTEVGQYDAQGRPVK
jgi:hypothetical protein